MSTAIPSHDFEKRLISFTNLSIKWCSDESEASTSRVTDAIEMLLQNTARVSELSDKSLRAIQSLQKTLKASFMGKTVLDMNQVIQSLEQLSKEHDEIQEIIQPIIRSLQFQDRLRQNLENIQKMLSKWLQERRTFSQGQQRSADQVLAFGQSLLADTTMKSERDVIRRYITELPSELEVAAVNLF